jgi:hypothetical protein
MPNEKNSTLLFWQIGRDPCLFGRDSFLDIVEQDSKGGESNNKS